MKDEPTPERIKESIAELKQYVGKEIYLRTRSTLRRVRIDEIDEKGWAHISHRTGHMYGLSSQGKKDSVDDLENNGDWYPVD